MNWNFIKNIQESMSQIDFLSRSIPKENRKVDFVWDPLDSEFTSDRNRDRITWWTHTTIRILDSVSYLIICYLFNNI